MATQYSHEEIYNTVIEYYSEEIQKRLRYEVANFAQLKYKRAMQMRLSTLNPNN